MTHEIDKFAADVIADALRNLARRHELYQRLEKENRDSENPCEFKRGFFEGYEDALMELAGFILGSRPGWDRDFLRESMRNRADGLKRIAKS